MRQYGDGNGNRIVECVQIGEVITQSRQAWTSQRNFVPCNRPIIRVAKCQFFTQIISVQLNLPQEKAQQVFDI